MNHLCPPHLVELLEVIDYAIKENFSRYRMMACIDCCPHGPLVDGHKVFEDMNYRLSVYPNKFPVNQIIAYEALLVLYDVLVVGDHGPARRVEPK